MALGNFLSGLSQAFSGYVTNERTRQRQAEDTQLDEQMSLIKALIDRPDVNPALLGRALTDLTALQQAKGSRRKAKGGKDGFMGASELPISQFLQGIMGGDTPVMGRTTEAVPTPVAPTVAEGLPPAEMINRQQPRDVNFDYKGIGVHAGVPEARQGFNAPAIPGYVDPEFTGESILAEPVPIPPVGMPTPSPGMGERLAKSGQAVAQHAAMGKNPRRPVAKQPLLRDPMELAEEAGAAEGLQYQGRVAGQREADIQALRDLGIPEQQIQAAMLRRISGQNTPRALPLQTQNWRTADGQPFSVMFDPDPANGGRYFDEQGNPFMMPPGAVKIGVGPMVQHFQTTDDFGRTTITSIDRYGTGVMGQQGVGNIGRTSPEGPVQQIQGPQGRPVTVRFGRRGSGVNVAMDPFTGQPMTPFRPETAPMLAEINAAQEGIEIIELLEDTFDPRYTGIVEGRWNIFNQKYNPFATADPNFSTFQARWATARNNLLRINAGLTQTPQEKQNIEQQLMLLTDKDENFTAKLQVVVDHFERKQKLMMRNAGMGIPFLGGTIPPPPGSTAPNLPQPPQANPGRGVQLRHKATGQTRWEVDPAKVDFAKKSGLFEVVR